MTLVKTRSGTHNYINQKIQSKTMHSQILKELKSKSTEYRRKNSYWFFKTGPGEYGEGDAFLGVAVPDQRAIAKKYRDASLKDVEKLLQNKLHECRLTALFILIHKYNKADAKEKKIIVNFYKKNLQYVNNWDLVDSSASYILGDYLLDKDRKILYTYANSKNLWKRRVAIIATMRFLSEKDFKDSLKICEYSLKDKHDLIHKATGWVLREIGKKDKKTLITFLDQHVKEMPRTMLRYAIEKLPEKQRQYYLKK